MTDFSYETARKTTRQHRTLSFNPQSSLKPTQQTNTHNKSFTKRKTPSKRYMYINQSEINKTIDFSSFRTHHKTLSVGKQNQFIALPQIHIPKNKRGAKKGSYLQIWLNQALDEGQGNQNFLTSLNDQTLGALKKYGIDKKLLKGKNISQQTIDKIYKKLYVYSKGLGMTFQQIGKLATMKSPFEQNSVQGSGKQIIEVFWRAFSKIMQNQTPYESAFQVMQKNYLKTIQELRLRMRGVGEQIQNMQKEHSQQKRKLQRELQMLTVKYRQLQNQHKVNKSTLQLTDKTLDEQVQLRLKFEQKINSVYTSYNELKQKYADLVEELGMKKQLNFKQQKSQCELKELIQRQQTKCRQMQHLLSLQQAKVRDLQTQLLIKKQQKTDLQRQLLSNQQKVKKQYDELSEYVQKNKLLTSLLQQSHNQMSRMKHILQEQKQVSKKLQKRVEDLSGLNNRLYEDKYRVYAEAEVIKEKNQLLAKENTKKQDEIKSLNNDINTLNQDIQSLNNQLKHTKNLNNDITYQLQVKKNLLQKANQNLTKLKQIKDRHQRLHALAQYQRNQAINQNVTLMSKLQQLELQVQNLRNQILQKQQAAVVESTRFNKSKEFLTKKVVTLQQQLSKKDESLQTNLNALQIERIMMLKKQREINEIKQKMQTRQHLIYKLQSQSVLLATNQPLIQELLKKKQQQLNKQTQKNLLNMLTENSLKTKIQQIQVLLNAKSTQIHVEIDCYKKLSQSYKQMYDKRRQHVHPMVHEDMLMQLERMARNVQKLNGEVVVCRRQNEDVKTQYDQLSKENDKHKDEILRAHEQIKGKNQSIEILHTQSDNLRKSLKQEINKSLHMLQQQKKLKGEISKLINEKNVIEKRLQASIAENKQREKQFQSKNKIMKELEEKNCQISLKYQKTQKQIKNYKLKCADMQEKLKKLGIMKLNATTQTDPIKLDSLNISNDSIRKSQKALNSPQQPRQITPNQLQNLQSKQITQTLIQHSFQPTVELKRKQQNQQLQKFMNQTQKQPQVEKQKATYGDKKKIQKGQFKRALKLTFMRR